MTAYLVGSIDIEDEAEYRLYRQGVASAMMAAGARPLSTDGHPLVLEGERPPGAHLLLVEFPSTEAVRSFLASDAYSQAVPHRWNSSTTHFLMVMNGVDE